MKEQVARRGDGSFLRRGTDSGNVEDYRNEFVALAEAIGSGTTDRATNLKILRAAFRPYETTGALISRGTPRT